ncbi:MAG: hypothetical protein A3A86_08335 [Elusimicrobia bacterium RIFCSPLOWO2_01_FULL_60_11]|nr:MAG: hypothetical protein A3A86_08335 [Elusimicrobia bacterium RIFCSPLOWO2_01_FULL_60_11]
MNISIPPWLVVAARAAVLIPLSLLAVWFTVFSLRDLYQDIPLRMGLTTPYAQRAMIRLGTGIGLAWWTYARGWKKLKP